MMFTVDEPARHGIEAIGPFEVYRITVDGYRVPRLTGRLVDGMWHFLFDERFGCVVPEPYGHEVAWLIGNAMAVGAGFSCFGKSSIPLNEFKNQLHHINTTGTTEAEVKGQVN